MKYPSLWFGGLVGGLLSLPLIALLYVGEQFANLPFTPFQIFDWLARALPGDAITLGIDAMVELIILFNLGPTGDVAKLIEQLQAIVLFVLGSAILGVVIALLVRRSQKPGIQLGMAVAAVALILVLIIESILTASSTFLLGSTWQGILILGWGLAVGQILGDQRSEDLSEDSRIARRTLLLKLAGGSAGIALGVLGVGQLLKPNTKDVGAGQPLAAAVPTRPIRPDTTPTTMPDISATTSMRERVPTAPGTRSEITPTDEFYRIDINTRSPVLNKETWVLGVAGLFDSPKNLTLTDLMEFPALTQKATYGCISNRIGGDLIGTAEWTGLRLRDLLSELGLKPEATELFVESADGFFESVVMFDMMDPRTMLIYGMNGETLPIDHGFPLRIYIPDRYGMKQPKWITRITATNEETDGYWVVRGWSREARPQIVSVIDTIAKTEPSPDGRIPVGGIAWAGDRGIQRVELQIDDGAWVETALRTPPLSQLTWVQWRYDWEATPGGHNLRVRATDGVGMLQAEEESGVRPDGATGYDEKRVNI
jgi:DMSO/TMAO reductase YedYZ molybdopterin-dependent catalytic subunit